MIDHTGKVRDHALSTYADFPAFWTPSPPPCSHFGLNHSTKFTQPRLLRTLFGPLPLAAYVLYGWSLSLTGLTIIYCIYCCLSCLVLLSLGTVTTVGLKRKVVDRTELDRSICTETDASFQEEFGIPYSQPNCELFMYENQYPNW